MYRAKHAVLLGVSLVLVACVTINIYFPAAAAEKAAESIVRDVLGTDGEGGNAPPAESAPEQPSSSLPQPNNRTPMAVRFLELLVGSAQAAEANIDISTPAIRQIRDRMASRHRDMRPHFDSGAIGFTRDARVAIRDANAIPLKDRSRVNRLVADDNRDRDALYKEIARANGHPEWEADIRSTFARVWVQESRRGWWYQDAGGRWGQK